MSLLSCPFCYGSIPYDDAKYCSSCGSYVGYMEKGRKAGAPTGRLEGRVSHVSQSQAGGKAQAGTSGPQSEHGYVGAESTRGTSPHAAGLSGGAGGQQEDPTHWHRRADGSIKRDVPMPDEEVEHIHLLTHEHIAVGHLVHFKDELWGNIWGKVVDCGEKGVMVKDGEGRKASVFFDEIVEIKPPELVAKEKERKK